MPQIATFLDTTIPNSASASRVLESQGWKRVPYTKGNRRTIMFKYYEYLVNTDTKMKGINPSTLTPQQLQPYWEKANIEYEKYDMYTKNQASMNEDNEMGGVAPAFVEEHFATNEEVEKMQPGYINIDDLLSAFSGLKFGGKRRKHTKRRHTKHKKHTKRSTKRSSKRSKTHKRKSHRK